MYKELSLCFIALILATAGGTPVANQDCLEAVVADINMLQTMLPNHEGRLYTPRNPGEKCATSAMECFMKEINITEEEFEHNRNITNTIKNIQRNVEVCWKGAAEGAATKDNECPLCESYASQSYKTFLKYMKSLVQSAFHRR